MLWGKQDLAAEIQEAGGIITADDLTGSQPTLKQPLQAEVSVLRPMPNAGIMHLSLLHAIATTGGGGMVSDCTSSPVQVMAMLYLTVEIVTHA